MTRDLAEPRLSEGTKYIISLLALLLTAALLAVLAVALVYRFAWHIPLLFVLFIPVGSWGIGMLTSSGFVLSARFLGLKIKGKDYAVVFLLVLLTAFMIHYAAYRMTKVNTQGELIYSFDQGTHISKFSLKGMNQPINQPITFFNYMKLEYGGGEQLDNSRFSVSKPTEINISVIGMLFFFLEIFGYFLGVVGAFKLLLPAYCEKCRIYYKGKTELYFDVQQSKQAVDTLVEAVKNKTDIYKALYNLDIEPGIVNLKLKADKCPGCGDGLLVGKIHTDSTRAKDVLVYSQLEDPDNAVLRINTVDNRAYGSQLDRGEVLQRISRITRNFGLAE